MRHERSTTAPAVVESMSFAFDSSCLVAPGFERVAEEFERNFRERGELGASFSAVVEGECVLDLWGGVADRQRGGPWARNTLQLIFSGTKGLVAMCLLVLLDRDKLELDAPVCEYWPEFAACGKRDVMVRDVVTHTAGLPGLMTPVRVDEIVDDRRMARLLAAQPVFSDPRARQTYHPLTFGWLCGELVRRIDGRSIGTFFADEFARPLGLEIYIGLPHELEERVSRLECAETWGTDPFMCPEALGQHEILGEDELARAIWANPPLFGRETFPWNERSFHASEIPGAGGIGTARSIAALYGALDGRISRAALDLAARELEARPDALAESTGIEMVERYSVGFMLQNELQLLGPPADAFGHPGAGGSVHGCWPAARTGFSYAMNLLRDDYPQGDPRPAALLRSLHACVAK